MQLTSEQIRSFLVGCSEVTQNDGAIQFHRVPGPMRPLYEDGEASAIRMACTSGVRLRFATDADAVSIDIRIKRKAREIFKASLELADGSHLGIGPDEAQDAWQGDFSLENTPFIDGRHIVDLWLPHLVETELASLTLQNATVAKPLEPLPINWLIYGDSITQGMTSVLPGDAYFALCAKAINAQAINTAIGGATCLPELSTTVPDGDFDLISLAFGTNEYHGTVTAGQYADNVKSLVTSLRSKFSKAPIVVITPPPWVDGPERSQSGETLQQYRDRVTGAVAELDSLVQVVQGPDMVPSDADYYVDGVHPNDRGMKTYAENLLPYLKNALNQ